MSKLWTWDL